MKDRVADRDTTIEELTEFKKLALSRLAAQQAEIMHLRSPEPPARLAAVSRSRGDVFGSCS